MSQRESLVEEVAKVPGLGVHLKSFAASEESLVALKRAKAAEGKRIRAAKEESKASLAAFMTASAGECWAVPGEPGAAGAAGKTRYLRMKESVSRKAIKPEMVEAAIRAVACREAAEASAPSPEQFAAAVAQRVEDDRTSRRENVVVDTSKQRGADVLPLPPGSPERQAKRLAALGEESRAVASRFKEASKAPAEAREHHVGPVQDFLERREGDRETMRVIVQPPEPSGAGSAEGEAEPEVEPAAADGADEVSQAESLATEDTPTEYFLRVKESASAGKITADDVKDAVSKAVALQGSVTQVVESTERLEAVISRSCLSLREVESSRAKTSAVVKLDLAPRKRGREDDDGCEGDEPAAKRGRGGGEDSEEEDEGGGED